MEFSPNNHVVKFCIQGMNTEENGKPEEAKQLFLQAWNEATDNFEKFLAAYYVARHQNNTSYKLSWLETPLSPPPRLVLSPNENSALAGLQPVSSSQNCLPSRFNNNTLVINQT